MSDNFCASESRHMDGRSTLTNSGQNTLKYILTYAAFDAFCDLWRIIFITDKKIRAPLTKNTREEDNFLTKILMRSYDLLDHIKKILKVFLESVNYHLFINSTKIVVNGFYDRHISIEKLRDTFFRSMKIIIAAIHNPFFIKQLETLEKSDLLEEISDFDDKYRFLRFSLLTKTFN